MKREPQIEIYKGDDGDWHWRFRARNGRIQADGAEGYRTYAGCKKALHSVLEALSEQEYKVVRL